VSQALASAERSHGQTPFTYYAGTQPRQTSARELYGDGLSCAGALFNHGIRQGDVVAIQLPAWYETTLLYQALAHLGAVILPIIHIYGPTEVEFILRQSKAKALITPDFWRKIDYVERCQRYGSLPDLELLVVIGENVPAHCISWKSVQEAAIGDLLPAQPSPSDVCALLYTSGTTSEPKGAQHTHNTLLAEWYGPNYTNRGLYLSGLPAGHFAGFSYIMRSLINGVPTIFVDHWNADFATQLIHKYRIKHGGGTPVFLLTMLEAAERSALSLDSLESFNLGGAGVTPAHVRMTDEHGFPSGRVYGSTEHPTVTYADGTMPIEKRAFTDGRIDRGNEVRIVDDGGDDLPVGVEGEIVTIGPELFVGYSDPELDRQSFLPGGWYKTGDIGRLDEDDFLTVTDRKKDIIIRGGENISSKEVEDVLSRHPAVREASVTAMPDETYGEKVCAFVILKQHASLCLEDVTRHFVESGVARQKTPEHLEVVRELPRTPAGKVKKFELRRLLG
jgi:acyl-coenzyme A synthetase/AMP-(fatty) acid ligase